MKEAKEFLGEVKDHIDEITTYDEWVPKVMNSDKPVILDCYADWCGPCRKLTPVLEQLAAEAQGKFKLVKLNIDNLPQISNALKVKSIPAVFLIHKGSVIDTFVGIPQQSMLEEFINTAIAIDSLGNDENVISDLIKRCEEHIQKGELEVAEKMFTEGLTYENWKDKFGPLFYAGIAYCQVFRSKDIRKAKVTLQSITEPQKKTLPDFYKNLLSKTENEIISFEQSQQPDEKENSIIDQIEKDPSNLEARFNLAKLQWEKQKADEAIESCLQIIQIERNWNERAAFNLLIEIFNKLGASNELVTKGRKRLAKILF